MNVIAFDSVSNRHERSQHKAHAIWTFAHPHHTASHDLVTHNTDITTDNTKWRDLSSEAMLQRRLLFKSYMNDVHRRATSRESIVSHAEISNKVAGGRGKLDGLGEVGEAAGKFS